MKIGVCAQVFYPLSSFADALSTAASLGFETLEIPVDARSPFVDLEAELASSSDALRARVLDAGLEISALSNHQEGQLLLGPHGIDTDPVHKGSPEEKIRYAHERLVQTAELARRNDVGVVCAFTGCEDYSRWFPWPLADGYERMAPTMRERLLPILDAFEERGVRFALECHPRQFAYNLETAKWTVELVEEHPALAFNFDPANLLLAGMDPVAFVAELGERIVHVHAKDGELVRHQLGRSGLLASGAWERRDRGFRFRVPGWGDVPWRRLLSELQLLGYTGVLSVEHEDPTFGPREGLEQALRFLQPLVPREPAPVRRWW